MLTFLIIYILLKKEPNIFVDILNKSIFHFYVDYYFRNIYIILIYLNFDFSIKLIEGSKK